MSIKFSGRHDNFVVSCEKCESELDRVVVDNPLMSGVEITCQSCGSTGLVYEDGGIYKLIDDDEPLNIQVE